MFEIANENKEIPYTFLKDKILRGLTGLKNLRFMGGYIHNGKHPIKRIL